MLLRFSKRPEEWCVRCGCFDWAAPIYHDSRSNDLPAFALPLVVVGMGIMNLGGGQLGTRKPKQRLNTT